MKLSDVLSTKRNTQIRTVPASVSILDAARMMKDKRIGSLLVEEDGAYKRIVSVRDIARKVVANKLDPRKNVVGDIASKSLVTAKASESVVGALRIMKANHIRHLPVTGDKGQIVGVLTEKDLMNAVVRKLAPKALVLAEKTKMKSLTFDQLVDEFETILRQLV